MTETENAAPSTEALAAAVNAPDGTPARKPGKQPGVPGFGRPQILPAPHTQSHYPAICAGCGQSLINGGNAVAYTGFQSIDLREGEPDALGLQVDVTDHRDYEVTCACGHHTRVTPGQGAVDAALTHVTLNEWRRVGPGLGALIVALRLRFRMARPRLQKFLHDWLGIDLSIGTIHQATQEAGAAVLPVEAEPIAAVQASGPLLVDETLWLEGRHTAWLWVFTAATVTLYAIAGRGRAILDTVLAGFNGWLMSDGWCAYRHFEPRLRCWAHLLRKAQGLIDSYGQETCAFGRHVLDLLKVLMAAVYATREGSPTDDLPTRYAEDLACLRMTCEPLKDHTHAKT
ncbi:MAG: transposase, partial [Candidatus Competibacteraceae bacterium]|nr:transposase [Candidatus Competibacteraceae bacterium]